MAFINQLILLCGALFIVSILASTLSPRMGMPLLLVFLILGMLAGSEGVLGIEFEDVKTAYLLGTLALIVILFDGGLRTDIKHFRVGLRPALLLATLGVLIVVFVCAAFCVWWLHWTWIEGLLVGAIVGSTDAAAVFSVLHSQGLALKSRVGATLEIESGINDPMAVFLTIALVDFLSLQQTQFNFWVINHFVWEMSVGSVVDCWRGL